MALTWSGRVAALKAAWRADAEFFDPRSAGVAAALIASGARPLGTWVSSASRGVAPAYSSSREIGVIKTNNVRRFELIAATEFVDREWAMQNPRGIVPRDALIMTSTGVGSAGRCFVKLDDEEAFADAHISILPVADPELAAFLCAYLQSPVGFQQTIRLHRGSSRQIEIYPEDLLSIPVPSVSASRRSSVAARWMEAVARVDAAADAVAKAEGEIARRTGMSTVAPRDPAADRAWSRDSSELRRHRRIDPEYTEPYVARLRAKLMEFGATPLSALVTSIRKGVQPEGYTEDGSAFVIKSKDVRYPGLDPTSCERADLLDPQIWLSGGEVLLNSTGEGTLGRASVVPPIAPELTVVPAVDLFVLGIDRSQILPDYLALYLNSAYGRLLTTSLQTGSSGQQHLNEGQFSLMLVPIPRNGSGGPDLGWQKELIDIANERALAIEGAKTMAMEIDDEFLSIVGQTIDLSTVPR